MEFFSIKHSPFKFRFRQGTGSKAHFSKRLIKDPLLDVSLYMSRATSGTMKLPSALGFIMRRSRASAAPFDNWGGGWTWSSSGSGSEAGSVGGTGVGLGDLKRFPSLECPSPTPSGVTMRGVSSTCFGGLSSTFSCWGSVFSKDAIPESTFFGDSTGWGSKGSSPFGTAGASFWPSPLT